MDSLRGDNSQGGAERIFKEPIEEAMDRITKKPFGLYATPGNSPVDPEHFTGFHSGVDFEVTDLEQNREVNVYVICDGPLLLKRSASGYGGVAVQSCEFKNQPITVIYGHIKLSSLDADVGQELEAGERLAVLGTGFTTETDGERKHLHLGIHKGTEVDIRGYVQNEIELNDWINVADHL